MVVNSIDETGGEGQVQEASKQSPRSSVCFGRRRFREGVQRGGAEGLELLEIDISSDRWAGS
jgi:hypothetical protein